MSTTIYRLQPGRRAQDLRQCLHRRGNAQRRAPGQQLQQSLGYNVFRYFENIKPGNHGGGWVDNGGSSYKERYGEEVWTVLFGKAPGNDPFRLPAGAAEHRPGTPVPAVAGAVFEQVDSFIGKMGKPVGVASYKPYHSSGEDFLHDYISMIGIPMEMTPTFPTDAPMVFLTESAKFDPAIVSKIKAHLTAGKKVMVTSGFYKAMQGKGIEDIAELEVTDHKFLVRGIWGRGSADARPPNRSTSTSSSPRSALHQRYLGSPQRYHPRRRLPAGDGEQLFQGHVLRADHSGHLPRPVQPAGQRAELDPQLHGRRHVRALAGSRAGGAVRLRQ